MSEVIIGLWLMEATSGFYLNQKDAVKKDTSLFLISGIVSSPNLLYIVELRKVLITHRYHKNLKNTLTCHLMTYVLCYV